MTCIDNGCFMYQEGQNDLAQNRAQLESSGKENLGTPESHYRVVTRSKKQGVQKSFLKCDKLIFSTSFWSL